MRLLKRLENGDLDLISFHNEDPPPYAILSHTWATDGQEVRFDDLLDDTAGGKTGYAKVRFCVDRAARDGLEYSWVDTCCIDRSTSDELNTAINSMFRWYQRAAKCYVYLSDVHVPDEVTDARTYHITWIESFRRSRWHKRGWTLQELIAPPVVDFFSKEGKHLGSKISLEQELHQLTRIPLQVLRGQTLSEVSVEERMSWADKRMTLREEDKAYCLLGIFGVFLPLIYGEGEEHAMMRLKKKVTKRKEGHVAEDSQDSIGMFVSMQEALSQCIVCVAKDGKLPLPYPFLAITCSSVEKTSSKPSNNSFYFLLHSSI